MNEHSIFKKLTIKHSIFKKLTIKHSIILILAAFLLLALVNEFILLSYIHKSKGIYDQFSMRFTEMQNEIHQKILEDDKKFDEYSKNFEKQDQDFHKMVEDNMKTAENYFKEVESEALERNRKINEELEKLPKKLFAEHEAFGKRMESSFLKGAEKNRQDFKKHIVDVDKRIKETRDQFDPYGKSTAN